MSQKQARFLQEAVTSARGVADTEAARSTGVYLGSMYTEYLDSILAPVVSSELQERL